MVEVKVLIEGYAGQVNGKEHASSTTTLIRENNINIIVDPGMNRKLLLEKLKEENLTPDKINYVILSHNHMDHMLLTGIFINAKVLDDSSIYSFEGTIEAHDGKVPGTSVEIIPTPGHDQFHCSVLVNTKLGKIVIASDVIWWWDNEEQKTDMKSLLEHKDPYVKDEKALLQSRKKILEIADYVIPGHGKMFRVKK